MISAEPSTPTAGTVAVPLAPLAIDGTPPAEGDEVTFTVTGRIVSARGGQAQVQVATINDQPIAMDEAAEDRALMEQAMAADASASASASAAY